MCYPKGNTPGDLSFHQSSTNVICPQMSDALYIKVFSGKGSAYLVHSKIALGILTSVLDK